MDRSSRAAGLDATFIARARTPGSARHYAILFAPGEQRAALTALFAVQGEIQAAVRSSADHAVSHARLEWWRGEMQRLVEGKPAHPVTRALRDCAAGKGIDLGPLREIVTAAEWDLAKLTLESPMEFETAAWRSDGIVHWIGMQLADVPAVGVEPFARQLGSALKLERSLLTLRATARSGAIPLPLSELNRRHVTVEDLQEERPPAALSQYVAEICSQARKRLLDARSSQDSPLRSALRAHIVLAVLCDAQLARIERAAGRAEPFQQEMSPLQRLWKAWRAARRCS